MAEPRNRYSTVSLILHWLIAAMILAQVLLITAHEATEGQTISREFVQIHKALGLTVLILTLTRIGWRIANPAPSLPDGISAGSACSTGPSCPSPAAGTPSAPSSTSTSW